MTVFDYLLKCVILCRVTPVARQHGASRPQRNRNLTVRYQGLWQKFSLFLRWYVIRRIGLYDFEDKGEVKRCSEKLLKWM